MAEPLRRVGRYELIEVIGRGGTAVVYLALQPDLGRQVALKELSPHHAGDPRFAARFVEESRLSAALNHPNIVTVHEFFEQDGLPYISMEYLPRGSLRPYLSTLSLPQIFGVAENVLAGLAHGETHHIIHRDLKPENLLVSGDGQVKISDYGVARALDSIGQRAFATMTGTAIGTPAYMAPEQALGQELGPEADLYSLGVIIWEALAGHPPFGGGDTPMAVLYQKIHEPVPRIQEVEPDVDPGLAEWLDVALAKTADVRFGSAARAWDELEDVAIKLLGPRWRRDARINLEVIGALEVDEPDPHRTPSARDEDPRPRRAVETRQDIPVPEVPARSGERTPSGPAGDATLMRLSRRHVGADDDLATDEEEEAGRRWIAWVGLLAVVVVAAAVGVAVAIATNPKAPVAGTRTQTTAEVSLAGAVRPIISGLARAQAAGTRQLAAQKTSAGQAAAARALQKDVTTAETALGKLPSAQRALAAEKTLSGAVGGLALGWEKAAYAARTNNSTAYASARTSVQRESGRVAAAAAVAEESTSTGTGTAADTTRTSTGGATASGPNTGTTT